MINHINDNNFFETLLKRTDILLENLQIDQKAVPVINSLPNITYHREKNHELKMSLLLPKIKQTKPAVLFLPGGGFRIADQNAFLQLRLALAQAGLVVASIEYRVIPAAFPASLYDGKYALSYLVKHATALGIDSSKIAVMGASAGGYLAQFLGVTSETSHFLPVGIPITYTKVWKVVSLFGFCELSSLTEDLKNQNKQNSAEPTLGLALHGLKFLNDPAVFKTDRVELKNASPINYVSSKNPPFLLLHGTADHQISLQQLTKMAAALKQQQVPVTAIKVAKAGHGSWQWYQPKISQEIINWLKQS